MTAASDIEGYLIHMGISYEEIAESTWVLRGEEDLVDNIVVSLNEPVVLFRVKLMDIDAKANRLSLYETLLRYNTTDMLHGAYGLEGDSVVATDTLQSENLDFNEFQASVDALSLCLVEHYETLSKFQKIN